MRRRCLPVRDREKERGEADWVSGSQGCMWIRLPFSCLQRKSNRPVRFIISSVDSAAESSGDMAIYWESPLTQLSMDTGRAASQLEKLRIHCFVDLFQNKLMTCCVLFSWKKNENGKLLIFKLNSGSEWEPLSLPTHIADVNMSFVTESLDANIWTVIEERGRVLKGPLFVLLAEYKVLRGDPIARLPVDLQSTGSSSTQAPQTSSQPLHCNHLTFQLKRKLRKKETCSEARSPSTLCFFYFLYRTQC